MALLGTDELEACDEIFINDMRELPGKAPALLTDT